MCIRDSNTRTIFLGAAVESDDIVKFLSVVVIEISLPTLIIREAFGASITTLLPSSEIFPAVTKGLVDVV